MSKYHVAFFYSFFLLAATSQTLSSQSLSPKHLQEKIYIQTDKQYYYPGETIWFSVFINYRSPGLVDTLSQVLYIELYDSARALVQSRTLKIDSGRSRGSFSLPFTLSPGSFTIRAYTQWLLNYGEDSFFYKFVPILNPKDNVNQNVDDDEQSSTGLKIEFDKTSYRRRDKVTMKLKLEDPQPRQASVTISVTDANQVVHIQETNSIKKNNYFEDSLPKSILQKFKYPVERGISFEGVIISKDKKKGNKLSVIQGDFQNVFKVEVDYRGYFAIRDLLFYDTSTFTIQLANAKVFLKEREVPAFSINLPAHIFPSISAGRPQRKYSNDTASTTILKEVEIKRARLPMRQNRFERPDLIIRGNQLKNYYNTAEAIQSKVPGYRLVFSGSHWRLYWTRSEYSSRTGPPLEPIVYINNSQMLVADPGTDGETVGDRLANLDPKLIDQIETASAPNTSIGGTGSVGVLYIFTKGLDFSESFPTLKVKGFDKPAVFRSPDYENPLFTRNHEDFRSTLYWNPIVKLNSNTSTEISFFTSDQKGAIRVIVEGVTTEGKQLRIETKIVVE